MEHDFILVVDDDPAMRDTIVDVLEDAEYPVRVARDGREALELLQKGARPCLVLLDLMMPRMNGWDFAQAHAQDPDLSKIPFCIITAVGPGQPMPDGAAAIMRKPLQLDKLLKVVAEHC
jgi:CheY-like chemotaxis protein